MGRKRQTGNFKIKFLKTLFLSPSTAIEIGTEGELERRIDHFAIKVGNSVFRYDYELEPKMKKYYEKIGVC